MSVLHSTDGSFTTAATQAPGAIEALAAISERLIGRGGYAPARTESR